MVGGLYTKKIFNLQILLFMTIFLFSQNWNSAFAALEISSISIPRPFDSVINPATKKLYVVATPSVDIDKLFVIDTNTNNIIKELEFSRSVGSIAINTKTNQIFLTRTLDVDQDLIVIDGSTDSVVKTVPIKRSNFEFPTMIAVNENTNKIYILGDATKGLTVVDGNNNFNESIINLNIKYDRVVVNLTTNKIYLSTPLLGSNIAVIDGNTNTLKKEIRLTFVARELAVNPVTNKVYVNTGAVHESIIEVIDGSTDTVLNEFQNLKIQGATKDLEIDPDDNKLYVLKNYGGNYRGTVVGFFDLSSENLINAYKQREESFNSITIDTINNKLYGAASFNVVKVLDSSEVNPQISINDFNKPIKSDNVDIFTSHIKTMKHLRRTVLKLARRGEASFMFITANKLSKIINFLKKAKRSRDKNLTSVCKQSLGQAYDTFDEAITQFEERICNIPREGVFVCPDYVSQTGIIGISADESPSLEDLTTEDDNTNNIPDVCEENE